MDDDSFDTPNCPRCLERLQIAGTEDHPYWICPNCQVPYLGRGDRLTSGNDKSAPPPTRR